MIRSVCILTITLVFAAALAAATTITFDPWQGLVEVDVVIDGHAKGRFGIDTGADHFYIDRTFATEHALNLASGQPTRAVVGIEGHSEAFAGQVRSLEIGDQRLYNLDAVALDIHALIKDDRADPPDGLIGYNILRRFYVTVDYPNRQLTLQQTEPDFLHSSPPPYVSFETKGHLILVNATFNDSIIAPMALDYCASYVAISSELASRLNIPASTTHPRVGRLSVNNLIATDSVYVGIADMSAIRNRLQGVPLEGLIGASFLYRHKITIDYKRNRIYLHD